MVEPRTDEAVEIVGGRPSAPIAVTCEHASNRLPEPWSWPPRDRWLTETHWAYDLGAEPLARQIAERAEAPAVLARFTRLLADPNRPEHAETLFRSLADGEPIDLNRRLDDAERQQRLERYHRPYHAAVDSVVAAVRAPVLLAVHSFTPVYEGEPRGLEVGVLFDRERELGGRLAEAIAEATGAEVALNEPYSGYEGLIYAVDRHARAHGRRAIEIEARQDLAVQPEWRRSLADVVVRTLVAEAAR